MSAVEPELAHPIPRPVRLRGGLTAHFDQGCLRLFILPHTVAGVVLLFGAVARTLLYFAVLLLGIDVEGRVVEKEEEPSKKGPVYSVRYTFTVDGQELTDRSAVNGDDYTALQVGDAIPVRTLPWTDDGHWARVPGSRPFLEALIWCGAAVFWNGLLSVFLWEAYAHPWVQRRLVRRGRAVSGVVRRIDTWTNRGGMRYRLHYEFPAEGQGPTGGTLYTGTMTAMGPEAAAVRVGDVVTVLHHPRRLNRNLLYRLADYQVRGARP